MFYINKNNFEKKYRVLKHSDRIFHEALNYVTAGEFNFVVVNSDGEEYGLEYVNNDDILHSCKEFPKHLIDVNQALFPEYFDYDEYDEANLYLEIFENYTGVFLKEINEYNIVIAKVLLKFSDKKVYILDKNFLAFLNPSENLKIISNDDQIKNEKIMTVVQGFVIGAFSGRFDVMHSIELFHNIFYHQYIKSFKKMNIKGVIVTVPKTEGIGSIINYSMRMKYMCNQYDIEMYLKSNCTRYNDELLKKYFKLPIKDINVKKPDKEDIKSKYDLMNALCEDENGNYYIDIFITSAFTYEYYKTLYSFYSNPDNTLTLDILNDKFIDEMEEYRKAVFKNMKVLGVLVRGTDYIVCNLPYQPLPLEELIPMIRKIKEEGNYDSIFLATEDKDYYKELFKAFPNDMIAIAQNRISQSELRECHYISELEKIKSTKENYDELLEDDMVNYFYALYLLSKCNGFLGTPICSGILMVGSFNRGKFEYINVVEKKK